VCFKHAVLQELRKSVKGKYIIVVDLIFFRHPL